MSRLRQVVVAARDLREEAGAATKALETFVTFRDRDLRVFGLENVILPLGSSFLEVVSPLPGRQDAETAAGRFIARRGEGGYMIAVQVRDAEALQSAMQVAQERALRVVHKGSRDQETLRSEPFALDGPGFERSGIAGFHLHPEDVGCIAELAVQAPRAKWAWAGNDWTRADERTKIAHSPSLGIAGVEVATPTPRAVAENWVALLGLDAEERLIESEDGSLAVVLDDDSKLVFRKPGRAGEAGLSRIRLYTSSPKVRDGEVLRVGGCDVEMVHPFGDSHL